MQNVYVKTKSISFVFSAFYQHYTSKQILTAKSIYPTMFSKSTIHKYSPYLALRLPKFNFTMSRSSQYNLYATELECLYPTISDRK